MQVTIVISGYTLNKHDAITGALNQSWNLGKLFTMPEGLVSRSFAVEASSDEELMARLHQIAGTVFEANGDQFCGVRFELEDTSGNYLRDIQIGEMDFYEIMGQLISSRYNVA